MSIDKKIDPLNRMGNYDGSDEKYTPAYGVVPILKYIPEGSVVWCPFDQEHSQFVQVIRAAGFKVIHSHIFDGQDFYNYEPDEHWDVMISNPPYKHKKEIFMRALSFRKPLALLIDSMWLRDEPLFEVFDIMDKNLELLIPHDRIEFINEDGNIIKAKSGARLPFKAIYFCSDFLPSALEYVALDEHDANKRRKNRIKTHKKIMREMGIGIPRVSDE